MQSQFFKVVLLFGVGLCTTISCQKDDVQSAKPLALTVKLAEGSFRASTAFAKTFELVRAQALQLDALSDRPPNSTQPKPSCASVSLSAGAGFPKILNLGFGESCTDLAGSKLSGALVATFSGPIDTPGTQVSIVFKDFRVNQYLLAGSYKVVTTSLDADARPRNRHDLVAGTLTDDAGPAVSYDETVFSALLEGHNTNFESDGDAGILDDVWQDNRAATVFLPSGGTYALTTSTPVARPVSCGMGTRGEYKVIGAELSGELNIDLGAGSCDSEALARYQGEEFTIGF